MKILYKILFYSLIVSLATFVIGIVVSMLGGSFGVFYKYDRLAGRCTGFAFIATLILCVSLIIFRRFAKSEDSSYINIRPNNKDEWRKLRHHADVAVLIFIVMVASVVLVKVYILGTKIDLTKGYYLKGDDACMTLYNPKGSEKVTAIYGYKIIDDLIIGYSGPYDMSDGRPFGYFILNVKTDSLTEGLDDEEYIQALRKIGINVKPELQDIPKSEGHWGR